MKNQAKAELKKQRDEINKFFDRLEDEMDKKIMGIDKNNKDTFKAASGRRNIINDELNKMKTAIETNRKNGQKYELFIKMKRSKPEIEKLDIQFEMLYEESKVQRYKLVQSAQTEKIMKNAAEICRMLAAKLVSEIDVSSCKDNRKPRIRESGALTKCNVITTRGAAYDVVAIAQHLYVVYGNEIKVLDMHGNVLKTIECDRTTLPSIAVSPDKKIIYLTRYENNSLTSITLEGQVIAIYKDKDLRHPWGITVDGEVFVYVRSEGGIHQLTKDCTKVQIILDDMCGGSITYSGADNRLYVAGAKKVKVYDLK